MPSLLHLAYPDFSVWEDYTRRGGIKENILDVACHNQFLLALHVSVIVLGIRNENTLTDAVLELCGDAEQATERYRGRKIQ